MSETQVSHSIKWLTQMRCIKKIQVITNLLRLSIYATQEHGGQMPVKVAGRPVLTIFIWRLEIVSDIDSYR